MLSGIVVFHDLMKTVKEKKGEVLRKPKEKEKIGICSVETVVYDYLINMC